MRVNIKWPTPDDKLVVSILSRAELAHLLTGQVLVQAWEDDVHYIVMTEAEETS